MKDDLNHFIHDLNNKLFVIKGRSSLIARELGKDNVSLDVIRKNIASLNATLEDTIGYCQFSLGPSEYALRAFDLLAMVQNLKKQFESDQVSIALRFDKMIDYDAKSNSILVNRLLTNLLTNSVQANASQIIISLKRNSLSIQDNGPGIEEALLKSIMSGTHHSTKPQGLGLGLRSVLAACKQLNWSIEILNTSSSGGGLITRLSFK